MLRINAKAREGREGGGGGREGDSTKMIKVRKGEVDQERGWECPAPSFILVVGSNHSN